MGSMKQAYHFVPCKDCEGRIFHTHKSFYWTSKEDDAEIFCIAMVVFVCEACNLTTYYAQEQDILDRLEPPSLDICN